MSDTTEKLSPIIDDLTKKLMPTIREQLASLDAGLSNSEFMNIAVNFVGNLSAIVICEVVIECGTPNDERIKYRDDLINQCKRIIDYHCDMNKKLFITFPK